MLKKVSFSHRGKKFEFVAEDCDSFGKFRGLMFRRREKANALLFDFKKKVNLRIHSFFVFFPFIAIWLDGKGKVIEVKKIRPFSFSASPGRPYQKILEIPINRKYKKETAMLGKMKFFVGD